VASNPNLGPESPQETTTRNAAPTVSPGAISLAVPERPGTMIGRYKLLRTLGRGGMGMVYRAEQQYPVKRQVALKIIKPGMDSEQAIMRFEAERQALALMDHPNIARVFDAGTTDAGRLYFVMELVEGVPIATYCEEHKLDLRARLQLFADVCQAIQHAHQKGIVHRDIKPSNVLVAVYDGQPVPKVIDFGVAKAVSDSSRLSDSSMMTMAGAIVGTYEYMSPEQARGGAAVDTRSDIYSLGVLLYELLTGTTPLEREAVRDLPDAEIVRRISEDDPPRPSARARELRGDLDWIAMKALEKEPARRYATANGLAADVQRYLNGEPVSARPPSTTYLVGKFARRYRAPLTAAAVFVVLLVAATIVSTMLAIRARRAEAQARRDRDRAVGAERAALDAGEVARQERDRATGAEEQAGAERDAAVVEKRRADMQAAIAAAVNRFLQEDVLAQAGARRQLRSEKKTDPDITVRTALDRAAARINEQFASQPEVEASLRTTIGGAYFDLGLDAPAQQQLERAVALDRRRFGSQNPATLDALQLLGRIYFLQQKFQPAAAAESEVLESRRRTQGPDDSRAILAESELALITVHLRKPEEAEKLAQEAVDRSRRKYGAANAITLDALRSLGGVYLAQDYLLDVRQSVPKKERALAVFGEVLQARRDTLGSDHPDTLDAMSDVSTALHRLNKFVDAEKQEREILEIRRRVLGRDHPDTLSSMANLADDLYRQPKIAEAEQINLELLDARRRVFGPEHPATLETMDNLANTFREHKPDAAEQLDAQALEIRKRRYGPEHSSTLLSMRSLAADYRREGKLAEAEPLSIAVLEIHSRTLGSDDPATRGVRVELSRLYRGELRFADAARLDLVSMESSARMNGADHGVTQRHRADLALDYNRLGDYARAEPLAHAAFDSLHRSAGDKSLYTLYAADVLAEAWNGLGRHQEAEQLSRASLALYEKGIPEGWQPFYERALLGNSLAGQKKYSEAEPLLLSGYAGMAERKTAMDAPQRVHILRVAEWVSDFYLASGRREQAANWRAKADAPTKTEGPK